MYASDNKLTRGAGGPRASTRVHAPPGGGSSISFGGGAPPARQQQRRAPAQQQRQPQQQQRQPQQQQRQPQQQQRQPQQQAKPQYSQNYTSSGFKNAMETAPTGAVRSSTRLHAPPGGKTSDIFGGNRAAPAKKTGVARQSGTDPASTGAPKGGGAHGQVRSSTRLHAPPGGKTSGIFGGSGGAQQKKGGVRRVGPQDTAGTGAPGGARQGAPAPQQRSSTRVHAAPGGASSLGKGSNPQQAQRQAPRQAPRQQSAGAQKNKSSMQLGGEPAGNTRPSSRGSSRTAKMNESQLSFGDDGGSRQQRGGGGRQGKAAHNKAMQSSIFSGSERSAAGPGPKAKKQVAHVKLHAPPGGRSNISF